MIYYKDRWKNKLNRRRLEIIELINRLFKMVKENNKEEVEKDIIKYWIY